MHALLRPTRSSRGSAPAAVLLAAVLVAACGADVTPSSGTTASGAAPSVTTPTTAPASAAPDATAAAADPTPEPTASAQPGDAGLLPGVLAVTVTDDLRVRSEPRVAADSARYMPTLRDGTELVVMAGPVRASGYTWYKVAPMGVNLLAGTKKGSVPVDQGWVAVADHDGTPWVAVASDPTPGYELASATVERPPAKAAAARRAAAALNAFGIDLYRRMLADPGLDLRGKGVVMSPASVMMALAMARAGAKGDTAAEMDDVLRLDGWDRYATELAALDQLLRSRDATWGNAEGEQHRLALRMANQAFGQRGFAIHQPYLDRVGGAFGSPLALVDYVDDSAGALKAINGWVARQTMNRIPSLLSPENVTRDTRLILVNAVYLKGEWVLEFEESSTKERVFTTLDGRDVKVPTMQLYQATIPLATGKGWRATELAYRSPEGEPGLSMTLILPEDMKAFERSLSPAKVASIDKALATERRRVEKVTFDNPDRSGMDCGSIPYVVNLYLPRFGIATKGDLVPALGAAGMRTPMSGGADFSDISDQGLKISGVIHEANIDVDEKGTEAAAATAIVMDTTGGCGGPVPNRVSTLRLDSPFMYLLRDTQTGAILFMGRVANPLVRS